MSKKSISVIIITIIILAIGAGVWRWEKVRKNEDIKRVEEQKVAEQKKQEEQNQKNENVTKEEAIDLGDWKLYRNYEYGFEVKYLEDLEFIIESSNPNKPKLKDSFIFRKDRHLYFAIFTNGGFGYGAQEPKKITKEKFKEKESIMSWYSDEFPNFIHITEELPINWNSENTIEIRTENADEKTLNIFKKMYDSFQFIK